jgi:hypothetical protein
MVYVPAVVGVNVPPPCAVTPEKPGKLVQEPEPILYQPDAVV